MHSNKKRLAIAFMMVLILGGCGAKDNSQSTKQPDTEMQTNAKNSANKMSEKNMFSDLDAKDIKGNAYTAEEFGNYDLTVVNVWATWCGPCVEEMPELEKVAKEYEGEQKVKIVGLLMDFEANDGIASEGTVKEGKDILDASGITYPQLVSYPTLVGRPIMQLSAVPTTYFIDKTGKVVESVSGARGEAEWKQKIEEVLSKL